MSTYTVQSGDSLWEVSNHFHISLKELLQANPQIKNPDVIHPGDTIVIPNGSQPSVDMSALLEPLQKLKSGVSGMLAKGQPASHANSAVSVSPAGTGGGFGSGTGKPTVLSSIGHGVTGSGHGTGQMKPSAQSGILGSYTGGGHGSGSSNSAAQIGASVGAAAATAPKKPKPEKLGTPPWLKLAYNEYMQWQTHLKDTDVARRTAWEKQKILQYGAAGGLSSVDEWCSCFVNWVLQHSLAKQSGKGFVLGTRHALAASWAGWSGGKQVAPRRGAICVKAGWQDSWNDWKHVGFAMDWSGGKDIKEVTEYDQYSGQYIRAYYNISVEMLGGNQGHPNGYDMGWGYSAVTRSWQTSADGFLFIWPKWLP